MVTKISKWSRIQDSFRITPKIESLVVFAIPDIRRKFQKNTSITFWVILLTHRQTNKQTKSGKNITSLAEVIRYITLVVKLHKNKHDNNTPKTKPAPNPTNTKPSSMPKHLNEHKTPCRPQSCTKPYDRIRLLALTPTLWVPDHNPLDLVLDNNCQSPAGYCSNPSPKPNLLYLIWSCLVPVPSMRCFVTPKMHSIIVFATKTFEAKWRHSKVSSLLLLWNMCQLQYVEGSGT